MSHEGKMRRGEKWLKVIAFDPTGKSEESIMKDPYKKCDVDYYKENKENPKEVTKSKGKK